MIAPLRTVRIGKREEKYDLAEPMRAGDAGLRLAVCHCSGVRRT